MYVLVILIGLFLLVLKISSDMLCMDAEVIVKNRNSDLKEDLKYIENYIKKCDCYDFETICGYLFKLNGYKVFQTRKSDDGGRDLEMVSPNGEKIFVECKHYSECNKISTPIINKLIGVCANNGIKKAYIITTSAYASTAIELIDDCTIVDIERLYINDLLELAKPYHKELIIWLNERINITPTFN